MSGIVTEHLIGLVCAQVERHGVAVWFDPERRYEAVAERVADTVVLPQTAVHRYEGSFLALRRTIDPLLNDLAADRPPRLLVYVPLAQDETADALVELTAGGAVLRPGHPAHDRNTRLPVVARGALARLLPPEELQALVAQTEAGKLTLADLDEWAARGGEAKAAAVAAIYDVVNAPDVALKFLTGTEHDEVVRERRIEQDLLGLLEAAFDVALPREAGLAAARERLARHLLLTEFVSQLPGKAPAALQSVPLPRTPAGRQAAARLAQQWRDLRPHRAAYRAHAERVERELGLPHLPFTLEQLAATETFPGLEGRLQADVEAALAERPDRMLVELAARRQASFWSEVEPEVQARWALVAVAGRLLLASERVTSELKGAPQEPAALIERYAGGAGSREQASNLVGSMGGGPPRPHVGGPPALLGGEGTGADGWCVLDTLHRHLEQRALAFDFDVHGAHDSLQKLVAQARHRYGAAANDLAERFVAALERAKFSVEGVLAQLDVFKRVVAPALGEGTVAYVLVDALRYEMARELAAALTGPTFQGVTLTPAFAPAPTVTEVGMAALLPGAERGAALVEAGGGKLALELNGRPLKDRKERLAYLTSHVAGRVYETKLEALHNPRAKVKQEIRDADLVVVTSQEIDWLCEGDNVALARRTMDGVLLELQRAFRVLAELGVSHIVVTADHGYVFGDELGSDQKIDPPGGHTADLHRRVWVGRGGQASASFVRAPASLLGWGGDLEIAVPRSLAGFKVSGGARAYFHGGLALQECVVPVLSIQATVPKPVAQVEEQWTLSPGSPKITTRFLSIQVACRAAGVLSLQPRRVRVEVRLKGKPKSVSVPVAASYGFEDATGAVQVRLANGDARATEPNTITLMLAEEVTAPAASIHLLDAETGTELAALDGIAVAIAM